MIVVSSKQKTGIPREILKCMCYLKIYPAQTVSSTKVDRQLWQDSPTHSRDILPFSMSLLPRGKTKNNPDAIRRMVNYDVIYILLHISPDFKNE